MWYNERMESMEISFEAVENKELRKKLEEE
jgi:hypothetical protein